MSQTDQVEYFSVITKGGAALEAAAKAKGLPIKLTHVSVGDGNGAEYEPAPEMTALVNEVLRREIDGRRQDEDDPNIAWISVVLPADIGGFWIREFGIWAESLEEDGEPVLYAVGNHAPYYKAEKILGQATSHELQIPVIVNGTANIQIQVKDMGYASQSAMNGLLAKISELIQTDRDYGERLDALELFRAAIKEATIEALGLMKPDGATITIAPDGTISVDKFAIDHLGEFRFFWSQKLRPGYMPCYGGVIDDCAEKFPQIWEYLQTEEGQDLCVTEAEWQARVNSNWHTNADGTVVGWGGIGGCARFVQDLDAGTLRMPDVRGCLPEAVGGPDSPNVGFCQGDGIRNISGGQSTFNVIHRQTTGLFYSANNATQSYGYPNVSDSTTAWGFAMNASRVVPTASVNRPRTFGVLPCAYLGIPR